jgi:hypothetical protein
MLADSFEAAHCSHIHIGDSFTDFSFPFLIRTWLDSHRSGLLDLLETICCDAGIT